MKYVIIIGGGFMQLPLIRKTKELGFHTIVFDGNEKAIGLTLAKIPVVCDITDGDACVAQAQSIQSNHPDIEIEIAGVITAGTDMSYSVARIATALNLPGIKPEDALAASNKVLMRKRLDSHNVSQPKFCSLWKFSEAHQAMDQLGLPLVLKPARNMGSRGVVRINEREDIYKAWKHSKKFSKSGEMILEEFVAGHELSIDALAWTDEHGQQQMQMTGIADRIITGEPYFVELGHSMPSSQSPEILAAVTSTMKEAMQALGITQGAAKGDIRVRADGSIVIGEVAARLSGGFMSSHTFPLASGVDLLGNAVRIAVGQSPVDLDNKLNQVSIERCIIGEAGKILAIEGREAMLAVPDIDEVFFMKQPDDVLDDLTSNIGKLGHIIATASTREQAESAIEQARTYFKLKVDDAYGTDWSQVAVVAREKFGESICIVCKTCDGKHCVSGMPGMGAVGNMDTFVDNVQALDEWKITPSYIHKDVQPSLNIAFLGQELSLPVMTAPMTGTGTNMGHAISEYDLASHLLVACQESGTIAWLGDGASPDKYKTILQAVQI